MTSTLVCPNGHASDEPDYCSVCGAPMAGAPASGSSSGAGPASGPAAGGPCPECGTLRADADARYCEVCRYDFEARMPGPAPVAAPSTAPVVPPASAGADPPGTDPTARWEVVVTVDPSLDTEPDPDQPPPTDAGDRIFPIDMPEMLIGRRDDTRGIRPEIPVLDPAVSRRHAKLLAVAGGSLAILDLASANGTAVNGTEVPAGERHDLADGDAVTMGRWTRIEVRRTST